MRRSRVEAKIAEENSNLRRSRLQEETEHVLSQKEETIRRCRMEAEIAME